MTCPKLTEWHSKSELEMANFLNQIIDACHGLLDTAGAAPATCWKWMAAHSTLALVGYDAKRKPDLILLSNQVSDWRCVRAVGEMKSSSALEMRTDVFNQIVCESPMQ